MRSLTKSPLAFLKTALEVARRSLPAYSHAKSPHKFTQHQLFALLCLKEFLQTDYRGLVQVISEWSELREVLGLKRLPHYSTLCYAHQRLLKKGALRDCWQAFSRLPEDEISFQPMEDRSPSTPPVTRPGTGANIIADGVEKDISATPS